MMKRLFDFLIALVLLVLMAPVFAVVAFLVWVTIGRPIFFRQDRPGKDAKLFKIIKFRTMRDTASADGKLLPDGDRLTSLGAWLRRTSLDELPELINVLKGDMSLVGPRPLLPKYLPHYSADEMRRHDVRPGITGPAQIGGRNYLSWDERLRLDVDYVDAHSLPGDLRILAKTLLFVLAQRNVAPDVYAVMDDLDRERNR